MTSVHPPLPADRVEPEPSWHVRFDHLAPERLLVALGAFCALGFGLLAFVLHLVGEGPAARGVGGYAPLGGAMLQLALALVFGAFLLLAFRTMETRPAEGSVMAIAFSVVLLAFAGLPGAVAGLVGLVGALVGIVRHVKFTS